VDGIDWHLWKALTWTQPRAVCIEYNADFGIDEAFMVKYHDDFNRHNYHPQYHGASLKALTILAELKGFKLVGCDSTGHNAFYVGMTENMSEVPIEQAFYQNNRAKWTGMIEQFHEQFGYEYIVTGRP